MTTAERHVLGLAIITLANFCAATGALKTFEQHLKAEAQKTHIEAPVLQEKEVPYGKQDIYQLASNHACCVVSVNTVLTSDRTKILSE